MNIFYLDKNPETSAKYHNDKHTVKMIVEYAQLMSTAHRLLDGDMYIEISKANRKIKRWKLNDSRENILYKASHMNHPSNIWVRESTKHYDYILRMFKELLKEYTKRYKKIHKTSELLPVLNSYPMNLKDNGFIQPPQAMPDYCKNEDSVLAYRNYYILEKNKFNTYKTEKPFWLKTI